MPSIRIFSKNTFKFDHPANEEASVTVPALSFANVPEWVKESTMFKLAMKDENKPLEVIESRSDEIKAETNADKNPQKNRQKKSDNTSVENSPTNDGE